MKKNVSKKKPRQPTPAELVDKLTEALADIAEEVHKLTEVVVELEADVRQLKNVQLVGGDS